MTLKERLKHIHRHRAHALIFASATLTLGLLAHLILEEDVDPILAVAGIGAIGDVLDCGAILFLEI